ncbi:hypothetical protein M0805_004631 [Coniferiporia weirii]|nr:hypothetical protein M0805_004631 [Coniferiporia weirii]
MDVPGGPHFRDVTRLFDEASKDMALEELLMVDGFSLFEAMSAVEIGDPRMDSGAALPADEQRPTFDPLTPLLPEEVCWILDRTLACEMHWHAGNSLAQTVFTCLYMHHLSTISPDYITSDCVSKFTLSGLPLELVSVVVRAGVMAMVKCCDLAYRELIKGNVHDCEDWQGDKSEIPLYEMVLPQRIIAILEEAEVWLMSAQGKFIQFISPIETINEGRNTKDTSESRILKCIPLAVLHWRADIIRDIVLSGFELGLYAPDERSFAYWYLNQVLGSHESVIRELLNAVPQGSPAHNYLTAQSLYVMLLREMSFGCFIVLSRRSPFDATRRWTNFTVRYKWVLKPEFASVNMPDPFLPDYRAFLKQEKAVISEEQSTKREKAAGAFGRALVYLVHLGLAAESDPSLQLCRVEFVQHHLAGLLLSCESLKAAVSTPPATGDTAGSQHPLDRLNLVWDQSTCSWFPKSRLSTRPPSPTPHK